MTTEFTRYQGVVAVTAIAIGSALSMASASPVGLVAPIVVFQIYAGHRATLPLRSVWIVGLLICVLAGLLGIAGAHSAWFCGAAVFALALCIGELIPTRGSRAREADANEAMRIIESMPAYTWSATPDGHGTHVNAGAFLYMGRPRRNRSLFHELDRAGWRDVIHPDDYERVLEKRKASLVTGLPFDAEYRLRRADGVYRWFWSFGLRSSDEYDAQNGWYGTMIDIEDKKRAEEALRYHEQELSQLVNMVPSHLWRLTPDGEPIFFNQRMIDSLGVDVMDLDIPGKSRLDALLTTIHPDDAERFRSTLDRSLVNGTPFSMRYRLRHADGDFRWMSSRAEPLRNQDGRILQWYGLCHDVDEEMRAQAALRQRERELKRLVDTVPALIWSTTPNGTPTSVNKRFREITGATLEDITAPDGSPSLSVVHPDDVDTARQAANHSFATGTPYVQRYRQLRADGNYRWTETRAEPLRDEAGGILQWYGVSVDIDDLITAQEALQKSERFLWQLVETLPAMIDCAAPNGEPVYRSRQLREFLGYNLDQLDRTGKSRLGGTLDAGVHPDDLAGVKEQYAHCLATGEPYARRHRLRRFDGEYRWVETRAGAMRDAEGAIVQWNVICLDIDGEVRAQEELRLAHERLARASQAASLAELSASIAHEVNQPLAAIVANSHACQRWLTSDPPNIDRAHRTVERIIRDANGAADVVSRIRALFRQSIDKRDLTAIDSVIAEVCDLLAKEAARRGVRMSVVFDKDISPVPLDRIQIIQVLSNLIRNGMEAMDGIAGEKTIKVAARCVEQVVRIEVSDNGHGIQDRDRIFQPFFTTKPSGMGMGLAISRSVVESHGGKLWAENNESGGARVVFTLPMDMKALLT